MTARLESARRQADAPLPVCAPRRRRALVLSAALLAIVCGRPICAGAHVGGSTGYASIAVDGNAIRYALTLSPSALPAPVADDLLRARAGDPVSRERWLGLVRDKVRFTSAGRRCEPAQSLVEPPRAETEGVTLVVDLACAGPVSELEIRDDLFDVLGPDHHTLARVEHHGAVRQLAFDPSAREARIVLEEGRAGEGSSPSFFRLGVLHILTGYDHLLFLAALLLRGGRFWSLIEIITAFTIAHSITLGLSALGLVTIPERIVEPAIALSIVWVALENVLARRSPGRRWLVSFGFGLVHGFGFATALRPLHLPPAGMAWALLGFNLGVETGQAAVVVALLPVLVWMRGRPWEPRVVRAASLAVAAVGLVWLIDRVFFA